jgi:hypothetical protein
MPVGKPFGPDHKGGRPPGAENQTTREIKAVVQSMVDYLGDHDRLQAIMDAVAASKPEVIINFMAKICPKDINLANKDGKPFVIIRLPAKEVEKA